jgi:hypothetical protein
MNDALISEIQGFTLSARATLEDETGQQLEGIYGWLPDGSFSAAASYPAIGELDEARETRQRLAQFAADEQAIGVATKDARKKLIREAAFTWLNRIVAFRLLEERKLIKQSVSRLGDSNAFKFWLVEDANKSSFVEYQKGSLPLNSMREGPSDVAYRHFLLWQSGELAKDVSVLFDPGTLASRLCPRPLVLKQLVADMTSAALADAWKPGNEETIGWIYQAFNAEELEAAFAGARQQGKKFEAEDIPAVTQLFTIRWVVRFLVENTLGRLWMEMHPDSRLKESLAYLVPIEETLKRPIKLTRDISFLDPCCGSMHFGLVAFDLYVQMYREELERAGQPGWSLEASVSSADEIPASIIAHNIHGIDLDLRAVQLSALTLLLRARTLNPKCAFTDENLASANVEELTGGRLEEFIKQAKFSHPIYERILRALAIRLKDSNNLGSLLRPERDLERLVADERKKAGIDEQFKFAFPGLHPEQFKTQAGIDEFFEILREQILRHLDVFVRASRTREDDPGHFVSETAKGLRFMRIIHQRFDVVTTNPPYLSGRKMNKRLATLMGEEYKAGKQDLYAAFILRCQELLAAQGLLGMLTMHSYMFISSYEDMREHLRGEVAIEALAHFGGGLFAVGNPGTLQTAAFVFRKEPDAEARGEHRAVYFRLVRERDAEAKRSTFEAGLAALRMDKSHPQVFTFQQSDFSAIPGKPWAYWGTADERRIFSELPALGELFPIDSGLKTSGNVRFARLHWEVGSSRIAAGSNPNDYRASGLKWFGYAKGGVGETLLCSVYHVVNWRNDGAELKQFLCDKYPYLKGKTEWCTHDTALYFESGITWSSISPTGFHARRLNVGTISSNASFTVFPAATQINDAFGVLVSEPACYLMRILCPTINQTKGGVSLLPIPIEQLRSHKYQPLIDKVLVAAAAELSGRETTRQFSCPGPFETPAMADALLKKINDIAYEGFGLTSRRQFIAEFLEFFVPDSDDAEATDEGEQAGGDEEGRATDESEDLAADGRRWISYAFGTVLGRYAIGEPDGLGRGKFNAPTVNVIRTLIDPNGVMVTEKDHPQDIVRCIVQCLDIMRGRESAHNLIRAAASSDGGDPKDLLRGWLERFTGQPNASFWKYHFQLYRKRPIFWPLQSPGKHFTVWIFHERFSKDTLFKVRAEFVEPKVRWLDARVKELKATALSSSGRDRRAAEKEASQLADVLDDVQEFAQCLDRINKRGYTPHIDDGVLLNAAPLWELLPSWPETKKAWQKLEEGDFDWAQQAMEYWPERVRGKCETNKSLAIAHGLG